MALPTAYLQTTRNVEPFLNATRNAKAPPKFTQRFLEELDFKSTNDRLFINLLKALGFLSADGAPTARYFEYLDQSQSARVLSEALEEAYADLFQVRRDAQRMERAELKGKDQDTPTGGKRRCLQQFVPRRRNDKWTKRSIGSTRREATTRSALSTLAIC